MKLTLKDTNTNIKTRIKKVIAIVAYTDICKLTILICFAEYNKLIDNDKNTTIKYEVNSKQKTHTCNSNNNIIEEVEKKDVLTIEEEIQLAKILIKANIKESPTFHFDNLNNNNIKQKKKRLKIFLKESDILFLDRTFRSYPKSYYQVFNIIGHLKEKNISLPIISVIMKYKYEICYINLFENLKVMLYENNIDIDFSKIYLMTDFEKALRNALKKIFSNSIILVCYFHYIKSIVTKFKDYGLLNKKFLLKSFKLIFFFKLYPFFLINDKT